MVLGLIIGIAGVLLLEMGEGLVSRLGLAVAVCGGGYFFLGLLQMVTKR